MAGKSRRAKGASRNANVEALSRMEHEARLEFLERFDWTPLQCLVAYRLGKRIENNFMVATALHVGLKLRCVPLMYRLARAYRYGKFGIPPDWKIAYRLCLYGWSKVHTDSTLEMADMIGEKAREGQPHLFALQDWIIQSIIVVETE